VRTAGIILAAGESRRMGRPKAFLPFRDGTFLSTLAETFAPFCSPVVAVFGFDGEAAARLAPPGVTSVINREYRRGMLTSLQAGLRSLDLTATNRVLFTLVDHPAVSPQTLARLVETRSDIAIPRLDGKRGHPVLISRDIAAAFLREPETAMVRDVIDRNADRILYLDVNDPGIRDDVDDPSLYEALLAREAARL
jgi:CTP:molybdopterin cytidylyltransferase MocA